MPDDAPVTKTFTRSVAPPGLLALALGARLGDQLVERGRQLRMRADPFGAGDELAVDDDGRHRLHVVLLRLLARAAHLAVDGERAVDLLDLLAVEALRRRPLEERL